MSLNQNQKELVQSELQKLQNCSEEMLEKWYHQLYCASPGTVAGEAEISKATTMLRLILDYREKKQAELIEKSNYRLSVTNTVFTIILTIVTAIQAWIAFSPIHK